MLTEGFTQYVWETLQGTDQKTEELYMKAKVQECYNTSVRSSGTDDAKSLGHKRREGIGSRYRWRADFLLCVPCPSVVRAKRCASWARQFRVVSAGLTFKASRTFSFLEQFLSRSRNPGELDDNLYLSEQEDRKLGVERDRLFVVVVVVRADPSLLNEDVRDGRSPNRFRISGSMHLFGTFGDKDLMRAQLFPFGTACGDFPLRRSYAKPVSIVLSSLLVSREKLGEAFSLERCVETSSFGFGGHVGDFFRSLDL